MPNLIVSSAVDTFMQSGDKQGMQESISTATGGNAVAFGYQSTASGNNSSAFGYANTADGNYSSAFGYTNTASGYYSSAFGYGNIASAQGSLAVGYQNTASVIGSSAVGYLNTASGGSSSAFGIGNTASGDYSSAVGCRVKTAVNNTQEFGFWAGSTVRSGAVRVHGTGMVQFTVQDRSTEYGDGGTTAGSEADNTLGRGMWAIRRNGLSFILDYNDAGTIKNLTLGTVT